MNILPWNGKPITKPGFYSGVPMTKYHSGRLCVGPSLSSSGLRKIFYQSEAHFFDSWPLNPNFDRDAHKPNEGMVLGRAAHHLLLGQPAFAREFVITPQMAADAKGVLKPWSYQLTSAKEWKAQQEKSGLTVLTVEQAEAVMAMAERLGREPLIRAGVLNGYSEITLAWQDRDSGVWLLARPDVIPTDDDFCDLKTTRDVVSYGNLVRAIGEHGYHCQAALTGEGWRVLEGKPMKSFSFYFVESRRPHCARMVTLKAEDLDLGWRQCRSALKRFVTAMNSGSWPGPGGLQEAVQYVDLSEARRQGIESELSQQGEAKERRAA
jgi:hypothetical protein